MRAAEFVSGHELYREFQNSEFWSDEQDLFRRLIAAGNFIRSKNLAPAVQKVALRKLTARLHPEMIGRLGEAMVAKLEDLCFRR